MYGSSCAIAEKLQLQPQQQQLVVSEMVVHELFLFAFLCMYLGKSKYSFNKPTRGYSCCTDNTIIHFTHRLLLRGCSCSSSATAQEELMHISYTLAHSILSGGFGCLCSHFFLSVDTRRRRPSHTWWPIAAPTAAAHHERGTAAKSAPKV